MVTGFSLWVCLAGLYVLESLRLVTAQSVIFRGRWFGEGSRVAWPNTYPGNGRWAWTLLPLAPMLGQLTLISAWPLMAFTREGFGPNVILTPSEAAPFPYEAVRTSAVDDKTLRVNDTKIIRCESALDAIRAQRQIEALKALPSGRRDEAIGQDVRSLFDEARAQKLIQEAMHSTRVVRGFSLALWWILIVVFPALLLLVRVPEEFLILAFGGLTLVMDVAIAVAFAKAAGEMHPREKRKYRWLSLKFVFYPVAALRASDDLTPAGLEGVHPLVACCLLMRGDARRKAAKKFWRQVRTRVAADGRCNGETLAMSQSYNALVAEEMRIYLTRTLPEVLVEDEVKPQAADCRSYCPNCRVQYVTAEGECADCRGVVLRPFG